MKWNKIEHRLFSQITMNWRGRPLKTHRVIVDSISNTTTATGLTVRCSLDTAEYLLGITYTEADVTALPLHRHDFHGEWNYDCSPNDTPSPREVVSSRAQAWVHRRAGVVTARQKVRRLPLWRRAGTWLRAHKWSNVRQLVAISRELLARL